MLAIVQALAIQADIKKTGHNPIAHIVTLFKDLTEMKCRKVCLLALLDASEELWSEVAEDLLCCLPGKRAVEVLASVVNGCDDIGESLVIQLLEVLLNGAKLRGASRAVSVVVLVCCCMQSCRAWRKRLALLFMVGITVVLCSRLWVVHAYLSSCSPSGSGRSLSSSSTLGANGRWRY